MLFVQETHSDSKNEGDWRREWPGQVFLSHKQSNSAGVGILFSKAFSPQSVELHHVMAGHVLMVKAFYENVKMAFLCVYAPVLSMNDFFKMCYVMLLVVFLMSIYSWGVILTALLMRHWTEIT